MAFGKLATEKQKKHLKLKLLPATKWDPDICIGKPDKVSQGLVGVDPLVEAYICHLSYLGCLSLIGILLDFTK